MRLTWRMLVAQVLRLAAVAILVTTDDQTAYKWARRYVNVVRFTH